MTGHKTGVTMKSLEQSGFPPLNCVGLDVTFTEQYQENRKWSSADEEERAGWAQLQQVCVAGTR